MISSGLRRTETIFLRRRFFEHAYPPPLPQEFSAFR